MHVEIQNFALGKRRIRQLFFFEILRFDDWNLIYVTERCKGSLTLAMGKCLWFSVKIKVCQSSLSSP